MDIFNLIFEKVVTILVLIFAFPRIVICSIPVEKTAPPLYEIINWYGGLRNVQLDPASVAQVTDITLRRGNAVINLRSGKLFFSTPVNGRITGAVFKGDATLLFTAPNDIENKQIQRFLNRTQVYEPIRLIYFRFCDSTFVELSQQVSFVKSRAIIDKEAHQYFTSREHFLYNDFHYDIAYRLVWDLADPEDGGYFFADCQNVTKDRMKTMNFLLTIEPRAFENCSLTLFEEHRLGAPHHIINSFRINSASPVSAPRCPTEQDFIIPECKIETTIQRNGVVDITTNLVLEDHRGGTQFLIFNLTDNVNLRSIKIDSSESVLFFRQEINDMQVRVILPVPMKKGESHTLTFYCTGPLMQRTGKGDWILKDPFYWYPRYGYNFRSKYMLQFHTPTRNVFIGTGCKVREWEGNNYCNSVWVQDKPVTVVSFNLGDFESHEYQEKGLPPVNLFTQSKIPEKIRESIAHEVNAGMQFFHTAFHPCPYDTLYISEVMQRPDRSFPGHLNLTTRYFEEMETKDILLSLTHELAHQWWGHLVGWRTNHDLWLSEGFAEYSSLLNVEQVKRDTSAFQGTLKTMAERILLNLAVIQKAGPIWLGDRLAAENVKDFNVLTYTKGAYILHMIRHLMQDYASYNDGKFFLMLQEYAKTYAWKTASTIDFQKMAEKYYGDSLQWFFDQWIYGVDIPTYKFSYQINECSDSTVSIAGKIQQLDVPADFKMYVPITICWSSHNRRTERILVDKPLVSFSIDKIPVKPLEVIFNDFQAVLCKVKK